MLVICDWNWAGAIATARHVLNMCVVSSANGM
jgi:hypothetical protein